MKLLRIGDKGKEKPAILDNNKIRSLEDHIDDFDSKNLNFETIKKIKELDLKSLKEIDSNNRIGPCVKNPGKFIAIGLNYSDHASESGMEIPKEPIIFQKASSSIIGPNDHVILQKESKKLDWEIELAFVVGKETINISETEAPEHILGYCIVNDISEREWQLERGGNWTKGKSADTFGPMGPYLVTKDEIPDINNLSLKLKVNEKIMQKGNTDKMIFNVNFILSYLSKFMSLQPGDVVTTGTPPGVGMGMKPQVFLKKKILCILQLIVWENKNNRLSNWGGIVNNIDLNNRTAIVTGGSQGFGLAITNRFLASGANVIIWDIDEKITEKVLKEKNSKNLSASKVDVTNFADVETEIKKVTSNNKIDIFVNNAGITGMNTKVWDYPIEEWKKVLELDLNAVFYCCKAIAPHMIKNNYGRIVNISSIAGKEGNPNASAYSTAKAGVIGLTKSLGKELADKNIAVNCVTPAAAKTRIFDQMTEEHINYMLSKIPRNRFAQVDELASLVAWLACEENSFATGAVFDLSGGRATY